LFGAQASTAADIAFKTPPASAYNWTGFYIGGNVGGGWGSRDVDFTANDPATATQLFSPGVLNGQPPHSSFKTTGALGGLQLGYNWQFNRNWLAGLETDFNWSDIKGSGTTSVMLAGFPNTVSFDERIKWFGTVRARLGYLPTSSLLTYVTGGFAYGRVERSGNYTMSAGGALGLGAGGFTASCAASANCFAGSSSSIATGWTAGAGLEYAVWKNVTLKAEYLYVSLASNSVTETALIFTPGTSPASFNANFSRTSFNVARIGLNFRY
jgi:outer membrane immunogenic protein